MGNTLHDDIDHNIAIFSSIIEDFFSNLDNELIGDFCSNLDNELSGYFCFNLDSELIPLERKDNDEHTQVKEAYIMIKETVD